jgi:hypothetical protein
LGFRFQHPLHALSAHPLLPPSHSLGQHGLSCHSLTSQLCFIFVPGTSSWSGPSLGWLLLSFCPWVKCHFCRSSLSPGNA